MTNYNTPKPKVRVDPHTGCWQWKNCTTAKGYGSKWCQTRKRMIGAHRWMYELVHGTIPPKLEIDHLCRNKGCVNPAHLEAVAPRENTKRAWAARHASEQASA